MKAVYDRIEMTITGIPTHKKSKDGLRMTYSS